MNSNIEDKLSQRKEIVGIVVSDKMDKTISVIFSSMVMHSKYGKYIKRTSVMKAHDENNLAKVGDKVSIFQVRPLSKSKRWMLSKILESAKT